MIEDGEISGGRVPVEAFESWYKILQEDDPKGSGFTKLEADSFILHHTFKSMAESIKNGIDFNNWFFEYKNISGIEGSELEQAKKNLEKYFNKLESVRDKLA